MVIDIRALFILDNLIIILFELNDILVEKNDAVFGWINNINYLIIHAEIYFLSLLIDWSNNKGRRS